MDIPVKLAVLYMVFYSCRGAQFPDIKVLENCPYDGLPRCQFISKIALNPGAFCPNDPPYYPTVDAVDEECATKCYIPAPRGPDHCHFLESYECNYGNPCGCTPTPTCIKPGGNPQTVQYLTIYCKCSPGNS
uniref:uncharacterized protein LOC120329329 isoform X1 n=1 Tax=Styela clava TaxID=7725 RepID=UPI001939F9F2|nr:uncharacterized protein LOC120329329 isoform X1 [Styela clava]